MNSTEWCGHRGQNNKHDDYHRTAWQNRRSWQLLGLRKWGSWQGGPFRRAPKVTHYGRTNARQHTHIRANQTAQHIREPVCTQQKVYRRTHGKDLELDCDKVLLRYTLRCAAPRKRVHARVTDCLDVCSVSRLSVYLNLNVEPAVRLSLLPEKCGEKLSRTVTCAALHYFWI